MTAKLIDGKAVAASVQQKVNEEAEMLKTKYGVVPGLATVLVGENPASKAYVGSKQKMTQELGMYSVGSHLPADISQEELLKVIRGYGADPKVHGILVQLPLPAHLDQETVLSAVPLEKDVDGFHPINVGCLAMKGREPLFVPCTPFGCIHLIESVGTKIEGVCGRPGSLEHRRLARRVPARSSQRDGDDLSLADAKLAGRGAPSRHCRRGNRQSAIRQSRLDQARRDGD